MATTDKEKIEMKPEATTNERHDGRMDEMDDGPALRDNG